jgi:hypothetical protein
MTFWRVAVLAAVAAGMVAGAGSAGRSVGRLPADAYFALTCHYSHSAPDDPIVLPRQPERSHDHTFLGNVSTDAFSTPASLHGHANTCGQPADASAYWAPTLYAAGTAVRPLKATIYYRRLTTGPVRPFPTGLEMVAGNSHAVTPQDKRITSWDCGVVKTRFYAPMARPPSSMEPAPTVLSAAGLPRCTARANLELQVNFPDCSDGKATSPDHRSNMAYSSGGRCPASHPVAVPAISIVLRYPVIESSNVFLSSGGVDSGHADFMDAWNRQALTRLIDTCLNAKQVCQIGT